MSELSSSATPSLAGRAREREVLDALLDRAAGGVAQTLLLSGAAGVGKTALVESTVAGRAGVTTPVGTCLPLVSVTVPFLAVRAAIASVDGATDLVAAGDEASVPGRFDSWLTTLCAAAPVVLVIDDLHWADQGTLDTLMFVIAGPAARRLSVVATIRHDELGDGHPLQRWLATVRRLPRVTELVLGPLDRVATGDQLATLLGESPHQSLVEDVFGRSGGNPYLTRLMAAGLPPDARHAPEAIASDLRAAVLQAWFRLTPGAREVATILALGGGPLRPGDLAEVAGEAEPVVRQHLAAAVDAGALEVRRDGAFWFRHPLNAEVLEETVAEDVREGWHSAFADLLEERLIDGSVDGVVAVADHRYRAGDPEAGYGWAVRAAAALEEAGAHAHAARMVRRALTLHPSVTAARESVDQLLGMLRRSAANAGAHEVELESIEALLARTPREGSPLVVAELLVRRMHLRFSTGRAFIASDDVREAVRLSAVDPASPEHALALAELAHAELWQGDPEGARHVEEALRRARAVGDDRALCFALTANAMAALLAGDGVAGLPLARQGFEAGVRAREWWGSVHASFSEANALVWAPKEQAEVMRRRREELAVEGAPHAYLAWLSAVESTAWMSIGAWTECATCLRETLASDPGPVADVAGRLAAARLAVWQGRQSEAEQHLARADELFAEHSQFLAFEFDMVRAEVRLGAHDPDGAYRAALAGTAVTGLAPARCEWLVPLAARALADRLQADRDDGLNPAATLALLDELEVRFPDVIKDIGEMTPSYEQTLAGIQAWYAAELARGRRQEDEGDRWAVAAERLAAAELKWEEAYALRRAADSLLSSGGDRAQGASLLRRGLDLAEQLQARPLVQELQALATRSRVPTSRPKVAPAGPASAQHGVTPREREILALLIAGRTYAEIANELVISEKTVSSHVSNLLAKTGTSNRIELAGYALRSGLGSA